MLPITNYDAIIIGAGQAGVPLSTTLARAGWKTALIERVHVGGTCVNVRVWFNVKPKKQGRRTHNV